MKLAAAQPELNPVDRLFTTARRAGLGEGLAEMADFVTGNVGYLVHLGHSLRVVGGSLPLLDLDGQVFDAKVETVDDPMLEDLGIEWVFCKGPSAPLCRRTAIAALVLRAGVLARMLDRAFHHLEKRESGGIKTLQHQLVKAGFVECFEQVEQIRLESASLLNPAVDVDLAALHSEVSVATVKAAKLMGGHGFLQGEVNSLEIYSLCLSAVYGGGQPSGQVLAVPFGVTGARRS